MTGRHNNTPARTRSFRHRVLATGTALLSVIGLGATIVPAAQADTRNIVALGDSFSSNPDQVRNTLRAIPGPIGDWADDYPQTAGCLQAPNNFPAKLSQATDRPVDDYSCTATTSGSMMNRINQAIDAGAVRNDSTVVLAVGMNDYGLFGAFDNGTNILDPGNVAAAYRDNMQRAADRIRSVAPEARIVVPGALPTVDRKNTTFCALNVVPDFPMGVPVPILRDVENWNRDNQRAAAADIDATYVEVMDGARGHDTCAADNDRYVAGIVDTTTPNYNMMFHPSENGSQYLADTVAPHV
ncbi:GDSL-type esterase/lipase family protein [Corynebacterium glyciniphilum]|uniref:GDSL-type esterase/lipase family protein n=1 Tax=Corynebacterium glyciniphilum TaxID=1404244 RepID=UPI003FCF9BF8